IKEVLSIDILDIYTTRKIYEARPELIVAVGEKALKEVSNIKDIPILYTMVLHPYSIVENKNNISGISMHIPANKQLTVFLDVLPQVKTIGVLYTSDEEREILPSIKNATQKHGVALNERLVDKPQSIPAILTDIKNKIDALWILPNTKIVTPETTEYLILFSMENNIPILTFSENQTQLGASISLNIDPYDMGKQTGQMATLLFKNQNKPVLIKEQEAMTAKISINQAVVMNMQLTLNEKYKNVQTVKFHLANLQ
ncbi:MAG: hypothetical protein L3V56_14295, partial [Candidatus Magnetoovum sp. WYHC-5]|nr:hypothetical protein [Candidatus Magnetoovum sp. WYHC-5]